MVKPSLYVEYSGIQRFNRKGELVGNYQRPLENGGAGVKLKGGITDRFEIVILDGGVLNPIDGFRGVLSGIRKGRKRGDNLENLFERAYEGLKIIHGQQKALEKLARENRLSNLPEAERFRRKGLIKAEEISGKLIQTFYNDSQIPYAKGNVSLIRAILREGKNVVAEISNLGSLNSYRGIVEKAFKTDLNDQEFEIVDAYGRKSVGKVKPWDLIHLYLARGVSKDSTIMTDSVGLIAAGMNPAYSFEVPVGMPTAPLASNRGEDRFGRYFPQ